MLRSTFSIWFNFFRRLYRLRLQACLPNRQVLVSKTSCWYLSVAPKVAQQIHNAFVFAPVGFSTSTGRDLKFQLVHIRFWCVFGVYLHQNELL